MRIGMNHHKHKNINNAGFTLIEMMVAVAILGILFAIALPAYQQSIIKSKRTLATTALLDIATRQEKYFSLNNQYETLANLGVSTALTDGSGTSLYTLSMNINNAANPPTFTATATATGPQLKDTTCGNYTLNNFGQQTPTTKGCW